MTGHKHFGLQIGAMILLSMVLAVMGFFWVNDYIYQEKQGDGNTFEPYRGTLVGTYTCLPHLDTVAPQTDECVPAIVTETGEYYAIDFNLMSQTAPALSEGERFSASGTITPIERLSSDHWRQYNVEGIFSVTDSVKEL